ncbi:MAG: EndoU domain-containing protein [Myxococcales bacterium]|nr:EndoU domain-containing protein [Myxococcales bacterium]
MASGVPCGLLGDCARFDALGIHVGAALGLAQSPTKSLALLGRTRVSVSMLDALDVSVSLGGQHNREQTETQLSAQPLSVGLRVRLWPWFDRGGPDVALSVVQTIPSNWLGSGDAVPETTASIAGTKLWRWLQIDGSAGVLWRDGLSKPMGLRLSGSGFVRLYQTPDPALPRDSYRVGIQTSALFPLDRTAFLATTTALAVFEAATDRGLRFQLGIGAQTEGYRASGLALMQFSYSWGLRYRTGDGRAGIGGMPDWYLDYFMVDPVLEADGCIYTDPSSLGRLKIICIGEPEPIDASTIVHRDGRRFPVGLHVWIDKTDGTLMTTDREILARPDEKTAKLAIVVQQLVEVVRRREQKTGKPCFLRGGILHAVSDASLASMVAFDDHGSGASLLGYELARMIFCDSEPLASGVPSPLSLLGKGLGGPRSIAGGKVRDIIEHEKPVVPTKPSLDAKPAPPPVPPTPATPNTATKAETAAKEASDILTERSRKHIFEGEINPKRGNATGWHYEPTGSRERGTYVLEETRSPPDEHGVYAANVVIEGTKKKARSTFFPKEWTKEQVASAIDEAYQSKKMNEATGLYIGKSEAGVEIEMMLNPKGGIQRVNPVYKGPKYEGPKK